MNPPKDAVLLRIFIGETDRFEGHSLFEAIVLKAREAAIDGATVLRGPLSFGRTSRVHSEKILRLSDDLPIVIEIVDSQEQIDKFLPVLATMITSGLVTMEKVQAIRFGAATAT
jgi:PII-like signaling protein